MTIPGRGESVGEAYVRLRVSGSGLPDDIKKEFEKAEPEMKKEGVRQSEAYREGFKEDLDRNSVKDLEKSLDKQRGKRDHIADELGGRFGERMREALAKQFQGAGGKEISDRIFSNLADEARKNNSLSGFNNIRLTEETEKAIRSIQADEEKLSLARKKAEADAKKAAEETSRRARGAKNDLEDEAKSAGKLDDVLKRLAKKDLGKLFGKGARNDFVNAFGGILGVVTKIAAISFLAPLSELEKLGRALKGTGEEGDSFVKRFSKAFGLLGSKILNGISAISAGITLLPVVITVALGAIQAFIGPLAALITDLAGVIVALAGTIGIGLVGAVGALLPLLVPLIGAVGVLTLGFTGLSKSAKAAISNDFKPVTNELKDLQKVAQAGLFGKNNSNIAAESKALVPVFKSLNPFVSGVADALAKAGINFTKGLGGPSGQKFIDTFSKFAPTAITKLGKSFTSFFLGVGGLLRALVPIANKFLDAMQKGAGNFNKFANSKDGQERLTKFFTGAYASAKLLYTFVKDTLKVLLDLLKAGKGTGDTIFGSINGSLEKFDTFLKSGRGKTALTGFFDQTKTFLGALGKLVGGFGQFFGALNNGQSQNSLNNILTAFGGLFSLIAQNLPSVIPILHDFAGGISAVFKVLGAIAKFVGEHETLFSPIISSLGALYIAAKITGIGSVSTLLASGIANMVSVIRTGTTSLEGARAKLGAAVGGIAVILGAQVAGNSIGGAGGAAVSIGGGVLGGTLAGSVFGPTGALVGGIIGGITGIATALSSLKAPLSATEKAVKATYDTWNAEQSTLLGLLEQTKGKFDEVAKSQLANKLSSDPITLKGGTKTNVLKEFADLGFSSKEVIDAITGGAKPVAALRASLADLEATGVITKDEFKQLDAAITASSVSADNATQSYYLAQEALGKFPALTKNAQQGLSDLTNSAGVNGKKFGASLAALLGKNGKAFEIPTDLVNKFNVAINQVGQSPGAAENTAAIRESFDGINTAVEAFFKKSKDATQTANYFNQIKDSFRAQLENAGVLSTTVDALFDEYAKLPKDVQTKLDADTSVAKDKVQKITTALTALTNPKNPLIAALGVDSTSAKKALGDVLLQFGVVKKGANGKLVVDPTSPLADIKVVQDALNRLGLGKQIPLSVKDLATNKINTIQDEINDLHGRSLNISSGFHFASGKVVNRATPGIFGEAGAEALVPLNRPLNQVDPSVRALSAFAQGKLSPVNSGGTAVKSVQAGPNIVIQDGGAFIKTSSTNADAILAEVTARWSVQGY